MLCVKADGSFVLLYASYVAGNAYRDIARRSCGHKTNDLCMLTIGLYGDLYNIRNPCIMDWN